MSWKAVVGGMVAVIAMSAASGAAIVEKDYIEAGVEAVGGLLAIAYAIREQRRYGSR